MDFIKRLFKGDKEREEIFYAYLLLIPALLIIGAFRIYPLIRGLLESFHQSFYSPEGFVKEFVGLKNYFELIKSSTFQNSLLVTLKFNLIIIPIQIILSLILAVLLNSKKPGINYLRGIFLIPIAMSDPIASVIWKILLNPNDGLINGLLVSIGIPAQPFFTSTSQALWSIILMASWKGVAFWMIFLVAGIGDIPDRIYEAAEIDGAGPISKLFHITLPLLKPSLAVALIFRTLDALRVFDVFQVMLSQKRYSMASFNYFQLISARQMGMASAIGVIIFIIIFAFAILYMKSLGVDTE